MSSPYRLVRSLLAALLVHGWRLSYASAVLSLTPDNYAKETEGKILFLKLFAPWCGHCKAMRHDWERLSAEYEGHERYLVAEVDCTTDAEAETWCSDTFEVDAFPTVLFGDPSNDGLFMEEYLDDRDYESLSEFAEQMFATPICNVDHMENCPDETKAMLNTFLAMNVDELDKKIDVMEELIEAAEEELDEAFEILQVQYDDIVTAYEMVQVQFYTSIRFLEEIHELKSVQSEA